MLDEPLAALDPRAQQRLLCELQIRARSAGTGIVLSSQHVPEVEAIADVMIALQEEKHTILKRSAASLEAGRLYEVGVRESSKALDEHLKGLRARREIDGFALGVRSAVVRFARARTLVEVSTALGGLDLCYIRDITGSALAFQYTDLEADPAPGAPS